MRKVGAYCRKSSYFLRTSLNKIGMKNKSPIQPTEKEQRLIEQLRAHPDMAARFERILSLANCQDGPIKTADEIESLLIEEVRKLGNQTMKSWAESAEDRLCQDLRRSQDKIKSRKKKL